MYVMVVVAIPGQMLYGEPHQSLGLYVREFDVDAFGGRGSASLTANWMEARRFDSTIEAFEYWRRRSEVRPTRADGEANRPGAAYTIEVLPLADAILREVHPT